MRMKSAPSSVRMRANLTQSTKFPGASSINPILVAPLIQDSNRYWKTSDLRPARQCRGEAGAGMRRSAIERVARATHGQPDRDRAEIELLAQALDQISAI